VAFCGRGKALHLLPQLRLSSFCTDVPLHIGIYFFTSVPLHPSRHEFSVIEKAMVTVSEDEAQLDPRYHQRNRPVISPCPFLSARVCYKEEGEEAVV